jgi:hypothetical protein
MHRSSTTSPSRLFLTYLRLRYPCTYLLDELSSRGKIANLRRMDLSRIEIFILQASHGEPDSILLFPLHCHVLQTKKSRRVTSTRIDIGTTANQMRVPESQKKSKTRMRRRSRASTFMTTWRESSLLLLRALLHFFLERDRYCVDRMVSRSCSLNFVHLL